MKLDKDVFGFKEFNTMVDIHKLKKNIKGRLKITRMFVEAPNGVIYELIANEKALGMWKDHTINFGTAGKVLFAERSKGSKKEEEGETKEVESPIGLKRNKHR